MLLLSHCFLHSSSHWLETYEQCNQTYTKLHDIKVHSNNTVFLIFSIKLNTFKSFPYRSSVEKRRKIQLSAVSSIIQMRRHNPTGVVMCNKNPLSLHQDQEIIEEASLSSSLWPHSFAPLPQPSVALQLLTRIAGHWVGSTDGSQQWSA